MFNNKLNYLIKIIYIIKNHINNIIYVINIELTGLTFQIFSNPNFSPLGCQSLFQSFIQASETI